jgi:hypothetical protein
MFEWHGAVTGGVRAMPGGRYLLPPRAHYYLLLPLPCYLPAIAATFKRGLATERRTEVTAMVYWAACGVGGRLADIQQRCHGRS